MQAKRECDHDEPCETLAEHVYLEKSVLEKLITIEKQLADLQQVLEIFRQVSGFFSVGKLLAIFIIGVAATVGAATVIKTTIAAWLKG